VIENRVLKKIFVSEREREREAVTEGWRKKASSFVLFV
jgi:hypothetical protein